MDKKDWQKDLNEAARLIQSALGKMYNTAEEKGLITDSVRVDVGVQFTQTLTN